MGTPARLVIGASLLAALAGPPAVAADPQALAEALTTLYLPLGLTRAIADSCDRVDPAGTQAHAAALQTWRQANDAERLERLLDRVVVGLPALNDSRAKLDGAIQAQADGLIRKSPLLCGALPALFGDKTFALAEKAPAARAALEGIARPSGPQPATLYTAGQLSALAVEAYRQARERRGGGETDWVSSVMGRAGLFAVSGRVVGDSRLQQWTVDQQSLWTVSCDFATDAEERLFNRQAGRDVVVSGRIDRVYDFKVINLVDCRLVDDSAGIAVSTLPADSGLTVRPKTLFSIAQLSQVAMELFRRTPGEKDEDKVDAVTKAMQQLGPLALSGRAISDKRLRLWLPEQQSIWTATCDFADDAEETRFKQAKGRDVTVIGQIGRVYDFKVINLSYCRLLDDPSRLARSDLPDDAGLEYRPPSDEELYAGADKGIPADQIEAMLFREQFQVGINPGGGSYTDRNEDSYLLLKDGTAYHYDPSYPPVDVDAAQARRRAPQDWSRWERRGDRYVMTAAAGDEVDWSGFTVMKAFPPDARLDRGYYYQNVGQGGTITRISYTFRPDGTYERHSSGSFFSQSLAGTGPGGGTVGVFSGGAGAVLGENGFAVGGALKSSDTKGRYRLDGYALQLTDDDGTVTRLRVGALGDDVTQPSSLNIGGSTYWDSAKE